MGAFSIADLMQSLMGKPQSGGTNVGQMMQQSQSIQNEWMQQREPSDSERKYFNKNQHVAGMAAEDGKIVLNPFSKLTEQEKAAVVKNEGSRLFMRSRGIVPNFELTDDQKKAFANTDYGKAGNEHFLKQTIAARILSGDPSAGKVTPEQRQYADMIWQGMNTKPYLPSTLNIKVRSAGGL